jgi:hypothetical protein
MQAKETMPLIGETVADSFVWASYIDSPPVHTFCESVELKLARAASLSVVAHHCALPSYHPSRLQKFAKFSKKILHLWKFLVISQMRTNFAEMPGKTHEPGSREKQLSSSWRPRETRW